MLVLYIQVDWTLKMLDFQEGGKLECPEQGWETHIIIYTELNLDHISGRYSKSHFNPPS